MVINQLFRSPVMREENGRSAIEDSVESFGFLVQGKMKLVTDIRMSYPKNNYQRVFTNERGLAFDNIER